MGPQGAGSTGRNLESVVDLAFLDSSLWCVTSFLSTRYPFCLVLFSAGAWDMLRAYSDMREANYKNSDKYFHARGNYDAAQRGPGGAWAAKVIR